VNAAPDSAHFYLGRLLEPLSALLDRDEVTDIWINRPGEIWVETIGGGISRHDEPRVTGPQLERLARQVAAFSHQGISRAHPLLAATLPTGERVQVVLPPATRGEVSVSIRCHAAADFGLDELARRDMFSSCSQTPDERPLAAVAALIDAGRVAEALALAVQSRLNILVSGGTSSGKTTFLNALLRAIPEKERLVLIEDTPELRLRHDNAVGLLAVRGGEGEARVSADDLLAASLRMRPDRIIVGELRGSEAFTFLRAVNTGHPGSMTTIHADSPQRAIEQLALLVLQTGTSLRREDIIAYIENVIDLQIQLDRGAGSRRVSALALPGWSHGRDPAP
jgi:type IV secretion system protein VirB11